MTRSPLTQMITASRVFAGIYIFAFLGVVIAALVSHGAPFWVRCAWGMLSLLGLFVTLTGVVSLLQARRSTAWPRTGARLVRAWVEAGRGSDAQHIYSPMVEYEYSVAGRDYTGDCIDFSARPGGERWAQGVIDGVGFAGQGIQVYYSPQDHAISVIRPGPRFVHLLRLVVGVVIMVVGLLSLMERVNLLAIG